VTDLAELTTMRVGGPAHELVVAQTTDELVAAALRAWSAGDEVLVLGGGSNVVVADDGFDGTVLLVRTKGIETTPTDAGMRLRVQAGEDWDALVARTVANGWSGLEALSGIPGSVGAAPVQNIGAYGAELADTLVAVDFLDYELGEVVRLTADELALGYRTSAIKAGRQGIVLAVELQLRTGGTGAVRYAQLATALQDVPLGGTAPVADVREAVLRLRASKGMVLDADDPDTWSCGSFFTNPIVPENAARSLPVDAPRWPMQPPPPDLAVPLGAEPIAPEPEVGDVKLSAAWLIERAGITRGFALPGSRAAVSSKHTLAITNRGGATAEEVAELARYVRMRVEAEFGIGLVNEPVLVGLSL